MWNKGKENALHWIHGNPESIMALLFAAMKVSDDFAYYVANAIEARYNELKEEKNNKNQIPNDNEENHI